MTWYDVALVEMRPTSEDTIYTIEAILRQEAAEEFMDRFPWPRLVFRVSSRMGMTVRMERHKPQYKTGIFTVTRFEANKVYSDAVFEFTPSDEVPLLPGAPVPERIPSPVPHE